MTVEHITKRYGKKEVLKDICFEAKDGECIGVLGGNGSGKSTLLNVLAGISKGNGGSFSYKSEELLKNSKSRAKLVGYVPQNTPLIEELTAKDNLRLWYSGAEMKERLSDGVLAILGISDFINVPVHKMSGGMKKRLAIGCAVAHNPKILLLDEPSAALDLSCKARIYNYLKEFKASGGIIILATHDVQELPLCDKLYILKDGIMNAYEYDGNVHRLAGSL